MWRTVHEAFKSLLSLVRATWLFKWRKLPACESIQETVFGKLEAYPTCIPELAYSLLQTVVSFVEGSSVTDSLRISSLALKPINPRNNTEATIAAINNNSG